MPTFNNDNDEVLIDEVEEAPVAPAPVAPAPVAPAPVAPVPDNTEAERRRKRNLGF